LALSATVGNPDDFKGWMARVQAQKEVQIYNKSSPDSVKLILHNQRYSDLQKYIYVTPWSEAVPETSRKIL
jgi:superfamily II RNA helicase